MVLSEPGQQIDESDEHDENADRAMTESLEPGSNVTAARVLHSEKHNSPSLSTEEGMQIDESDEQLPNAKCSTDKSLEPDSNVAIERDMQ
jgi:hypothetical protein